MNYPIIRLQKTPDGSVHAPEHGATWPAHLSAKPDYRSRYVVLNCNRYRIEWVRA